MTDDEFLSYRDSRYRSALAFYDNGAISNKKWYRFFSTYVLVSSVAIAPILAFDSVILHSKAIAAILAPTVALATGLASKFRFHEYWLNYRAIWDALQHEVQWHTARVGPYKDVVDRNAVFVERVEQLISREGTDWVAREETSSQVEDVAKKIVRK